MSHRTEDCLCPVCHTWLLDKNINLKDYKSCRSCGYARENLKEYKSLIRDDIGDKISPIIDRPELIRPEEK